MDSFARKLSISLLVTVLLIGTFFSTLFMFDVSDSKASESVVKGVSTVVTHQTVQKTGAVKGEAITAALSGTEVETALVCSTTKEITRKPRNDEYFETLGLDTTKHPEILKYQIRWSNGNWTDWFVPGSGDEDSTANSDGTRRRMWAYFTDHNHRIQLCLDGDVDLSFYEVSEVFIEPDPEPVDTDYIDIPDEDRDILTQKRMWSRWTFDEGAGQQVHDSGSAEVDGILGSRTDADENDPVWITDSSQCIRGGCLKFDGDNDYVNLGFRNYIGVNAQSFTVMMWAKGYGYQDLNRHSTGGLFGWTGFGVTRGVGFGPNDQGDLNFWIPVDNLNIVSLRVDDQNDDDTWTHWTAVFDALEQTMKVYKNGNLIGSLDKSGGVPPYTFSFDFYNVKIGDRGDGLVNFNGLIDQVKYINRSITQDQIKKLYEADRQGLADEALGEAATSHTTENAQNVKTEDDSSIEPEEIDVIGQGEPQQKRKNTDDESEEIKALRARIKNLQRKVSELEREIVEREKKLTGIINRALAQRLSGKILLQVEGDGEAWYVDENTQERFYLKDGDAAYEALQAFGLGISNADLASIPLGIEDRAETVDTDGDGLDDQLEEAIGTDPNNPDSDDDGFTDGEEAKTNNNPLGEGKMNFKQSLAERLEGKILLQVEDGGQAWYVHNGKRYYMKNGRLAYQIMRYLSLGITNADLRQIEVGDLE